MAWAFDTRTLNRLNIWEAFLSTAEQADAVTSADWKRQAIEGDRRSQGSDMVVAVVEEK